MKVSKEISYEVVPDSLHPLFPLLWQSVEAPAVEGENSDVGQALVSGSPILMDGLDKKGAQDNFKGAKPKKGYFKK